MRGKKIDVEFISNFISNCIAKNNILQEEIVQEAKNKILEIDNKIKEVEKLKINRSKLLDVISTFEKDSSAHKEEIIALSFFKIKNQQECKLICFSLKNGPININDLQNKEFCINQLLECKIISRRGDFIIRGDMFNIYSKYILGEN